MDDLIIWFGLFFCITQSAMFSGSNLAFFSLTRLRLEIEAEASPSGGAGKVIKMREDSNLLLTTILWGNVGINVLLTLLSESVLAGPVSFAFSRSQSLPHGCSIHGLEKNQFNFLPKKT
jgi:CBS domain containing-hemolysin-like protein